MVRQKGLRDIVCYCRTARWRNFFYVCHLMLIAVMTGIITVKHNYCVLYTLFWHHVSMQYCRHQTVTSSSSSGAEPPLIGSFGLPNDILPLCSILDTG